MGYLPRKAPGFILPLFRAEMPESSNLEARLIAAGYRRPSTQAFSACAPLSKIAYQ